MSLLIAYDMDGTLVPSDFHLSNELSKMLAFHGYTITGPEIHAHGGAGSSHSKFQKLSDLFGWQLDDNALNMFSTEHRRIKLGIYTLPECRIVFTGAADAMRELAQRGHTQALCSNGDIEPIDEIIWENSLTRHFNGGIFTAPYLGMNMKPDPAMLSHVLRRAGHADGQRAVFVGDSEADMQAAKTAGFAYRIGYVNPAYVKSIPTEMKKLGKAGATAYLTHYRDLPHLITAMERS